MKKIIVFAIIISLVFLLGPSQSLAWSYGKLPTKKMIEQVQKAIKSGKPQFQPAVPVKPKPLTNTPLFNKKSQKVKAVKEAYKKNKPTPVPVPQPQPNNGTEHVAKLTYYWVTSPNDVDMVVSQTNPLVELLTEDGEVIASVPLALAVAIGTEGTGFLPDGRLINLANSEGYPGARFSVLDTSKYPYGKGSQGAALVPEKSIAVDTAVIPMGSWVYIPVFDGLTLRSGTAHNGCFLATDTGYSISGWHIDLFAGTKANYRYLDGAIGEKNSVTVVSGSDKCSQ